MSLSIVIVNFNARDHLLECLQSLARNPPAMPHRIVVVDNASTDGSAAAVRDRWPSIHVVSLPSNVGFAAGNNAGIHAAPADLMLLLNNDTIVPAGSLDALVGRLTAHPDAAAAGPRLVDADGRVEVSFGPMISPFGELRQRLMTRLHRLGAPGVAAWVERRTRREQFVDWVSGACLLVRRADGDAAGWLDERYFLYTEDVDFCAALRARGRRVLFAPAAEIVHLRGRSRATAPDAMNAAYRRSHVAFYEKHHPRWAPILKAYLRMKGQLPR